MNLQQQQATDSAYAQAVENERAAWHDLQAEPPGSSRRAQAWARWSEAISRTNAAWRQLNTAQHGFERAPSEVPAQRPC
jgi:hypothetical protein